MELQKATPQDLKLISSIAHRSKAHWDYPAGFIENCRIWFDKGFTPDYLEKSHTYLIKQSNDIIGMGALLWEDEPSLDQFWLLPEHIGKGLGREVFELFTTEAKKRDWPSLTIISDTHAEGFYQAMGARKIGEVKSEVRDSMLPIMFLALK